MDDVEPITRRARHKMPTDVREALVASDTLDAYDARPPYQRNDYIGWIVKAKRDVTRVARTAQMIDELRRGDVYMKMAWRAPSKTR
jgi:uncharacterized protein YdeI (YjbR/CyaY-like superfamily)